MIVPCQVYLHGGQLLIRAILTRRKHRDHDKQEAPLNG